MTDTVIPVKKKRPQDHKPKAAKGPAANPNAIDLGAEDDGQTTYPVRFLREDETWYQAHLPKGVVALRFGQEMEALDTEDIELMLDKIMGFLVTVFTSADADAIRARIESPTDRLDIHHVMRLIDRLSEKATGLPTT